MAPEVAARSPGHWAALERHASNEQLHRWIAEAAARGYDTPRGAPERAKSALNWRLQTGCKDVPHDRLF